MEEQFLNKYFELRCDIDKAAEKFETMHKSQLKCKKGCDSCCESLTIFPIEYKAIQKELIENVELPPKRIFNKIGKKCRFLLNGACSIYNSRPIICRTQGIPLMYESFNGKGFELSVCKLNFVGIDVTKFNMENALFMPPFNSRLFLLNKDFIEKDGNKIKPTERYKLNNLELK